MKRTNILPPFEKHRNKDYRKAIATAEKILTETGDSTIIASVKDNLASVYKMCGRYEDAKNIIMSMPVVWPLQIHDRMRSSEYILRGKERLTGAQDLKPYMHQDLFICCDFEGEGYFEIGDYENALNSFQESAKVIEMFLRNGKVTPDAYLISGTESNHSATVVSATACLYKHGWLKECEKELEKAYQITINSHDPKELEENPDCFFAYRESYHRHGLDEYKPCI